MHQEDASTPNFSRLQRPALQGGRIGMPGPSNTSNPISGGSGGGPGGGPSSPGGGRGVGRRSGGALSSNPRMTMTAAAPRPSQLHSYQHHLLYYQPTGLVDRVLHAFDKRMAKMRKAYRRHRRGFHLTVLILEMLYIFCTIPIRVGFYFDPYVLQKNQGWTMELTIFTICDILAEGASHLSLHELIDSHNQAFATLAAEAHANMIQRQRRTHRQPHHSPSSLMSQIRSSFQVAWSLNTIIPKARRRTSIAGAFKIELLTMMPIELFAGILGYNTLHILRLLKILRLQRVPECLKYLKDNYIHKSRLVQLMEHSGNSLLVTTVLIGIALCHFVACGYMALAHVECGLDYSLCPRAFREMESKSNSGMESTGNGTGITDSITCWAIEDQLVGASLARKYARALYWSSRSIITLGYYDVAAKTDAETAYAIMVQIAGAVFSTSVIATFLFIFRYRHWRQQEFATHVDNAKEYMKLRSFPEDVREGVLAYYAHVWNTHRGLYQAEAIERLPEHLRVSVFGILKAQRIKAVSFLTKESVELINSLALRLVHRVFAPKDWIIEKLPDGMFFVLRGSVLLESPAMSQPRYCKAGEHFAEFCLLYPGRAEERARAQTFCEVYKLPQRAFYNTLLIFYRSQASTNLERMRSMLLRRDQQQQKMKRMLGRTSESFRGRASLSFGPGSSPTAGERGVSLATKEPDAWRLPGSTFRKWWAHIHLLCIVFVAYEVPFYVVFDADPFPFGHTPVYSFQSITSVLVELFFLFDFIFRARWFAYIDTMALIPVKDRGYIWDRYKEGGAAWLDLAALVPISFILQFTQKDVIVPGSAAVRLLRLIRLRDLVQVLHEVAHIRDLSSKALSALTIVLSVTLAIHVTGCLWFLMARVSHDPEAFNPERSANNLTSSECLRHATLFQNCSWVLYDCYSQVGAQFPVADPTSKYTAKVAYLRSIYWASVALTTVGYGDIVAFSTSESAFAASWILLGGIINYGVVGAMSNIISNLTAAARHHSERLNTVNLVLAHFDVAEELRAQIRRYYHQQFYVEKVASEAKLLAHLPHQLRHRISLILHADSVTKIPLFQALGNHRLLYELTGLFRRRIYQRGDTLYADNSVCDELFVVVRGSIDVFSKRLPLLPVRALSEGDCFGVSEMMLRKSMSSTLVAVTVVDLSVITRQAFATKIETKFLAEVHALRLRAAQEYEDEKHRLDALLRNLRSRTSLRKYTENCRSLFAQRDTNHATKAKLRAHFYWDVLVLLLLTYNAAEIPFRICFLGNIDTPMQLLLLTINVAGDVILWTDIYLKLYYFECDTGLWNLITRTERDDHYWTSTTLKLDLFGTVPLYYHTKGGWALIMALLRLPRLVRCRQLPEIFDSLTMRLQQRFSSSGNIAAYLSPCKLLLSLLLAAHFAACVFYGITTADHNPRSWLHHDHFVHEHNTTAIRYLRAFYWALTTLTLVGSREIVPLDVAGTLWAGLTCLCCTFIVGHIVGELSELILEMDKTKKDLKASESAFEQFAKEHNLPKALRTRVSHYLKFKHSHPQGMDLYETFKDLSPSLRIQLMLDLHGPTLRGLVIAAYLNPAQLNGLAVRLRSELFIPGDNVVIEGDLGHKLFIVKFGRAMVLWKGSGTAVATLGANSMFGEVAFFLRGQRRIASVQTTTCSELLVLDRRAYEDLLGACQAEDSDATDKAMVKWVRECLKSYNLMTVEIVKQILDGDAISVPPTLAAIRDAQANGASSIWRRFSLGVSRGMHERGRFERKIKHLLDKGDLLNKSWRRADNSTRRIRMHNGAKATLSVFLHRSASFRSHRSKSHRVHAGSTGPNAQLVSLSRSHTMDDITNANSHATSISRAANQSGTSISRSHAMSSSAVDLINRVRRSMPFAKAHAFQNGSSVAINPASRSMREYYGAAQLREMEEECWRRYKVSLLMAGMLDHHELVPPGQVQNQAAGQSGQAAMAPELSPRVAFDFEALVPMRKTFCGAATPDMTPEDVGRKSVTTDGMRFLANFESVPADALPSSMSDDPKPKQSKARARLQRAAKSIRDRSSLIALGSDRKHTATREIPAPKLSPERRTSTAMSMDVKGPRRRRILKRSQSLPLFDRHFSHMIEAELHASNAKDHESKLNLGFELLQRCRQPELSYLFKWYLAWQKRWNKAPKVHSELPSATLSNLRHLTQHTGRSLMDSTAEHSVEDFFRLLSRCYRLWECVSVLIGLFYAISLPFLICFASQTVTDPDNPRLVRWIRFVTAVDLFCIFDVALKLTAFQGVILMEAGAEEFVSGRSQTRLAIDLFSSAPFDFLLWVPGIPIRFDTYKWYWLSVFQANKILRILQAFESSDRLAQFLSFDLNLPISDSTLRFIRSICGYLLAGHVIGCVWYRISLHAFSVDHVSWLSTEEMLPVLEFTALDDVSYMRRYLRSLHFAAGSITTVFYGDIVSMNLYELTAEIGVILCSIFIFGILVGAHGERIETTYKHKMLFEQNLAELYHFLKNNDVPRDIRQRLKLYYSNTWLKYKGHDDFEGVRGLSTLLVEDIAQHTLRNFAANVSILRSCDECFLRSLLTCLKHIICSDAEAIVRKGDVDRSMYFIARGKVLVKGTGFELVKEEGDFFGELSLLYGIPRSATCSSLGTSLLYVLDWETYERLLADYPEYRVQNRREWVVVSTVLRTGESRFRSIIDIVAKMEKTNWVVIDEIIRKAKNLN